MSSPRESRSIERRDSRRLVPPCAGIGARWREAFRPITTLVIAVVTSSILAGAASAATTPAPGQTITNTAGASFVVGTGTAVNSIASNAVAVVVASTESASLTPSSATIRSNPGPFTIVSLLTNTGNVSTTFYAQVAVQSSPAGGYAPQGPQIVVDLNGNGVADPGEPIVTPTTPLTLAVGRTSQLLVTGTIPSTATPGASAALTLNIQSQDQTISRSATTMLIAGGAATLSVTTSATPTAPVQGGNLIMSAEAHTSDATVGGTELTVDGAATSLVLLREPVAQGASLSTATAGTGASVLYHRRGDPSNVYSTVSGPLGNVDGVAFATSALVAGQPLTGTLTVVIANNAIGPMSVVGTLSVNDQGTDRTVAANPLTFVLPALHSKLDVFGTPDYVRPIRSVDANSLIYFQLTAQSCNMDPTIAETVPLLVRTVIGADADRVNLLETAPNSGIFRSVAPIRAVATGPPTPDVDDGKIRIGRDDTITATPIGCGTDAAVTSTLVDPAGAVFDSRTNLPITGVVVSLIDVTGAGNGGKPGAPAIVFGFDGVTAAPSTVTTAADGAYLFPLLASSTYRLVITPPLGYTAPSTLAPAQLPAGHSIDPNGSYGRNFIVANDIVLLDVPLDAAPISGLFVEKSASKSVAEIGDFVDYSVTVKNTAAGVIPTVVLHDRLPRGFSYQKGTTRLNGVRTVDPVGSSTLDFPVGTLAASQQATVTYRLKIGPGAQGGDGVNHARATSGLSQSNEASIKVLLSDGGVFSDRAYLIGKVFADCNRDGMQDPGERGIPDVRIVLEDGTSATTDEDGKYSLYGLVGRTHVAKVDATTLVEGTTLEAIDNRNAGDGNSRFVDMKNGELNRADFAVAGCGPALDEAIAARRGRAARIAEADSASKALLSAQRVAAVDARTLPSSGVLDAKGIVTRGSTSSGSLAADALPSTSDISDVNNRAARSWMGSAVQSGRTVVDPVPPKASLARLLPSLAPGLGFIDLADNAVMPSTQATIRVKGPANGNVVLIVNGQRVEDSHMGERSVLAGANVAAVEFVGVELAVGINKLELVAQDDFGNTRDRVAIVVRIAGRLTHFVVDAPAAIKADGRTLTKLRIRLLDADDLSVAGRIAVTLDASVGKLLVTDLDPREPGTQVLVEGGVLDLDVLSPVDAGRGILRVQAGPVKLDAPLVFVPDLRPLLAVGVIEGVLNFRSLSPNAIIGASSGDVFEREIQNVSRQWDDGKTSAAARAALYLKGKVLGSTLLTVAYDSDKPQRERLFRDIQPDQFYPVYGDSSVKGFDAQSTSRLYIRVDHDQSYVLYGDFTTQSEDPARSLTLYNRALTGAKGRFEEGALRVDGFAAYTSSQQVIDELRGNGTSGPFVLSRANGLVDSEQVHVITRDRNQPAIIIKDVPMTRFADYEIEPLTGRLLFKLPIPSVDADLDPISIRITYEVDNGGPSFWVGGVDAKLAVTASASIGGVYIRDTDPSNRATLRGVNGTIRLSAHSLIVGEFAETDSDLHGLGKGRRIEYKKDDENFQARLYGGKTDVTFVNPNALLSQGRAEYGGKVGLRLSEQDRLSLQGIRSEDPVSGGRRTGILATVERSFENNVKVELGARHVDETVAPATAMSLGVTPNDFNSVRAKVTVPVPFLAAASVFGEYERAIGEGDRQIAAIGGSFALPQGGKLYARHEFISSLSGAYDLNSTQRLTTTVIGVDSDYMKDGHLFNEYRVGGGIDARSSEAAIGLRNLWRIADGVAVTTTAENIKPIGGPVDDRSTAVTGAIDYTANPNWKGSARAEYRNSTASDSWLLSAGGAFKLSEETTLLSKAIYSDLANASTTAGTHRIARAQLGAAYRPVDTNVWNMLARIEIKREQDSTVPDALLDEIATIGSIHVNVSPSPDLSFNARYGVKRATDRSNGFDSHGTTQLLGGRMIKDLDDKWDVGLNAFILASDGIRSRSYALGAEAGYRVATNLWVSTGYNVSGFKDKDLAGEDYTQRGAYLRMRYKFDENLFGSARGDKP